MAEYIVCEVNGKDRDHNTTHRTLAGVRKMLAFHKKYEKENPGSGKAKFAVYIRLTDYEVETAFGLED